MKIKIINYERLFNLGNFSHEKIGLVAEVEKGESVSAVFSTLKKWVEQKSSTYEGDQELRKAQEILRDRQNQLVGRVEWAEEYLAAHSGEEEMLL